MACPLSCTCPLCIVVPKPDSDEEGEERVRHDSRKRAKRHRAPSPAKAAKPQRSAMESALCLAFPLASTEGAKNRIVDQLRQLEKYETALQGDDYADKDFENTNTEALQYARAAAAVLSCPWRFSEHLADGMNKQRALEKLISMPLMGPFRAAQILQLFRTGTCDALDALSNNQSPINSRGELRTYNLAGKSMLGAVCKRELSRVLGISPKTAYEMYHGEWMKGREIRSIAELRQALADRGGEPPRFAFGLQHFEQLQEPVPEAEALRMQREVRELVRLQRGCPNCALPNGEAESGGMAGNGEARCACCWHVDFAGGARRRGRPGHDADLLVWHKREAASWADGRGGCVLGPLLAELETRGRLVLGASGDRQGWQMPRMGHHARRNMSHRCHEQQLSESTRGFENLSQDYHDKVFGLWRRDDGGLHRIDIIVNSFPDEWPFTLLGWTGSRLLNRMLRQRAKELGLFLSAHALIATPDTANGWRGLGTTSTRVMVRQGGEPRSIIVPSLNVVPYEFVRTEADIFRILAGGEEDFALLYDPKNRNA